MENKGFFKQLSGGIGAVIGGAVGFVGGIAKGAVTLIETEGDWDEAGRTANKVMDSCVEGGQKIGEECEGLLQAGLMAGAGAAGKHFTDKLLNDGKNKHGKQA